MLAATVARPSPYESKTIGASSRPRHPGIGRERLREDGAALEVDAIAGKHGAASTFASVFQGAKGD